MRFFPLIVWLATIGAAALAYADGNRVLATYTLIVGTTAALVLTANRRYRP